MKQIKLFLTVTFCFFLLNCNNETSENSAGSGADTAGTGVTDTINQEMTIGDNSENSLDWPGTYKGVLPCADCEGIETVLTLSADKNYSLKTTYLGKSNKVNEEKGNFAWNKLGNTITLSSAAKPNQYLVGENSIWKLDQDGNRITGDLADKYKLIKQTQTVSANSKALQADTTGGNATLTETFWKLVEINGKPLQGYKGTRDIHIILKNQDHRVQGFAGCNNIMGSYELKEGTFIQFKKIASTLMACPDMSTEDALKKVLEKVDNYSISGKHLSLNKARMAPLARFEAVYLR